MRALLTLIICLILAAVSSLGLTQYVPPKIYAMAFQREVIFCKARFMCLMAGRRAGKTDAIKGRMKIRTTRNPNFRYMYITPLSSQCLEVYYELLADRAFMKFVKRYRERPYPRIILKNGSRIWFRSFQRPQGLRSTGEDEICVDESQDDSITEAAIDSVVMPMLSDRVGPDGQRGTLLMAGQFRGQDYRYERFWVTGQLELDGQPNPACRRPIFWSWRIPSSAGFAFQRPGGPEELELQKSLCRPATWEQEWECFPRANANAAFPHEQIDAIGKLRMPALKCEKLENKKLRRGYIAGVDIGRVVDPTKVVVVNEFGEVVYAEAFKQGQRHAVSARRAVQIAASFKALMIVDATGGATGGHSAQDSFVKLYREECEKAKLELKEFFWSALNKKRIIDQLSLSIQQLEIGIPAECAGLISELKAYEYKYNEMTRMYIFGAPRGQHDDYVSALAMAVEGLKRGWCPTGRVGSYGMGIA